MTCFISSQKAGFWMFTLHFCSANSTGNLHFGHSMVGISGSHCHCPLGSQGPQMWTRELWNAEWTELCGAYWSWYTSQSLAWTFHRRPPRILSKLRCNGLHHLQKCAPNWYFEHPPNTWSPKTNQSDLEELSGASVSRNNPWRGALLWRNTIPPSTDRPQPSTKSDDTVICVKCTAWTMRCPRRSREAGPCETGSHRNLQYSSSE